MTIEIAMIEVPAVLWYVGCLCTGIIIGRIIIGVWKSIFD